MNACRSGWRALSLSGFVALAVASQNGCTSTPPHEQSAASPSKAEPAELDPDRIRASALARAQLWRPPGMPVSQAYLGRDRSRSTMMECRFTITDPDGTTPKFHCLDWAGTRIRVKYGGHTEIPAEAAATRLLSALGFGADTVILVERLRCYGCPKAPFATLKIVGATGARDAYERVVDDREYEDFPWVSVERKLAAPSIEGGNTKGWAFFELESIDPSKGGAPRAHVDALRLLAVFLAHWDNKAENQRLVCLSPGWVEGTPCSRPFLLLQDVGSTFGPKKVDLARWEKAPLWEDRGRCTLSMGDMPYAGATFGSPRISERGRLFLSGLLGALSDRQLRDLFSGARFDRPYDLLTPVRPVSDWVRVFKKRVKAVSEGAPCPEA